MIPAPLRVRRLGPSDADAVREALWHALHVPPGASPPPRTVLDVPEVARYADGWGRRDGDLGVGAFDATGAMVGAAWLRRFAAEAPGYGFVDAATPEMSTAVWPGWRGAGVGTRLMQALLEAAEAGGVAAVSLSVSVTNPARRLYERFGFETIRADEESVVMQRSLGGGVPILPPRPSPARTDDPLRR